MDSKKVIILCFMVLFIFGCDDTRRKWIVTCDSGFSTGVSYWTYIDDGVIDWRVTKDSSKMYRKMLPGEICTDKVVENENG